MSTKKIFIYCGPGALKDGIHHLIATIKKSAIPRQVQLIDSKDLLDTNWEKDASLFILPGGADLPYVRKLNGRGNEKIRSFVESGGSFLGICAGSYFAGNYVEFAVGSHLEVQGKRELGFFSGAVRGPVYKEFHYDSNEGSSAISIKWSQQTPFSQNSTFQVYYNGGGYFVDAKDEPHTRVLACYEGLHRFPALIECKVGLGLAILSGAHFEYDPSLFNANDPYLAHIIPPLQQANEQRLKLANHIFSRLIV